MRNLLSITTACILLASCTPSATEKIKVEDAAKKKAIADSLQAEKNKREVRLILDIESGKVLADTIGLSSSPVKVMQTSLPDRKYSKYKDLKIVYKNTSNKDIKAIRFRWRGINAFKEPVKIGTNGGFTDVPVKAGATGSGVWDILSSDADSITVAWPSEVMFIDGTRWKLDNK